jgi:hypothetical protein
MPFKSKKQEKWMWAYLSGVVDGEGCIYIARHINKPNDALRYRIRLQITNTKKELLEWIQERCGGWIYEKEQIGDWKTSYDWVIADGRAVKLLQKLLPYLIIKKEQAINAISLRNGSISKEEAYDLSHILNRKGKEIYAVQK